MALGLSGKTSTKFRLDTKHDDRPINLAWGTHRDNARDRVKNNLMKFRSYDIRGEYGRVLGEGS